MVMNMKRMIPKPARRLLSKTRLLLIRGKYRITARIDPSAAVYFCPCCQSRLRSFVPFHYEKYPDVYNAERYQNAEVKVCCPVCGTIPRHRILAAWMSAHAEKLRNKSILYFACEHGMKLWLDRNHIRYTTADLCAEADLKLDIEQIDQPDASWDLIVCNHVLEHVHSYQSAIKELYRILKPGGTLICSFPIFEKNRTVIEEAGHTEADKAERRKKYGQADHLRVFGADSEELLKGFGFSVKRIDGNQMPKEILPVVGPADYDVNYLFVCRKPSSGT